MTNKLEQLEDIVAGRLRSRMSVPAAHDDCVLSALKEVYAKGYVDPILIGDKEKITRIADEVELDISGMSIIDEMDDMESTRLAVEMVNDGEADILMKGFLQSSKFLKVVLDRENGLRTNNVISHTAVFEIETYKKLLIITDSAVNICPDLKQKAEIIQNAVNLAIRIGIHQPKVAVLSAVEVVNPSMQSTIDAAALSKMAQRNQILHCTIDGPLAMDNAINALAALHKHIESEVAGDADILVVPNIEAGNILIKSLAFLNKSISCAVLTGAKVPIVLTSRADDSLTKYYSVMLALAMR